MPEQRQNVAAQTYFELTYKCPWMGPDVTKPETEISQQNSVFENNFIHHKGELKSRYRFHPLINGPRDGLPVRAISTFVDSNNVVHTVCLTATGLWQLNPNWMNYNFADPNAVWNAVGQFNSPAQDSPFAYSTFIDKWYFTNGGTSLFFWDGIGNNGIGTATVVAGGYFLVELDAHLVLANTNELVAGVATSFPQRVRWSASGQTTVWDPAVNVGAGYNDMLDCPDSITGLITIGRTGYVFRTNGITEMIPIGGGVQPFIFNHLWASDRGIGSVYPYSVASYGSIAIFISTEQIYQMSVSNFKPIGGGARDLIYNDLNRSVAQPTANIVPMFSKKYIHLIYLLAIPIDDGSTVVWQYSLEEGDWSRFTLSNNVLTSKARFCSIA